MRDRSAFVNIEVAPAPSLTDHLPKFMEKDMKTRAAFTNAVMSDILDGEAGDLIRLSGNIIYDWQSGVGVYDGTTNPNVTVRMPVGTVPAESRRHRL